MRLASLSARAPGLLLLPALLLSGFGEAQTAPAQPAAPATTPAPPTAPATQPARAPLPGAASAATARAASAIAVEVGGVIKGQIVACPAALKLSVRAVCLYSKNSPASLRPLIRGKLAGRALGDWKTTGTSSTLLASETVNGPVGAFVLLRGLSATESLVVVDAVTASAAASTAPRPATPAGVVKGQPYVLGRDLIGVVNVTALGANKYRLNAGDSALTVTVGAKAAQLSGGQTTAGNVELPFVPATDGKNLIFPLLGLRSLGCTVTPAGATVTVACGQASVGLRPIVF
ncbi:hypothetical protein E7T06_09230 [Deinococcus sp. Arct2-2]|uniref:hypothetical protein n=1 Tax=Deinococcus sp. Arct2-2 TaxID=2568653 RepID=UPI0010A52F6A|nr:hypothetical protein [Deinococcus sp. Arct2-2]THF70076.1 hypothetical protein E7T06_09230 [Deinococcus sp. Arct2-2]